MQAKEIKDKLKSLIREASAIDPCLARRLDEINRWVKDVKPGSLTSKRFVVAFLLQIIRDAEAWLRLKSLSEQEQQLAFDKLKPAVKYWYSYLFDKWLNENDPKFQLWRQKLMAGQFSQKDADLIRAIDNIIKLRQGTVVQRYIADLSMATDMIISSKQQEKPLCLQLTTVSEQFSQTKSEDWENTLRFWEIERGLFLSFNPSKTDFENQIANIALYNSDNLNTGIYLKFSL